MSQRLYAILIGILFLPIGAWAAGAATFAPSPSAKNVDVGERFTLQLLVDPSGEELDTARAFVNFPKDILRVEDVALGPLFPRQSPGSGYDNEAGTISEGGFSIGSTVTQPGVFATVTFSALKAGTARIEIADNSRLISNGTEKGTGAFADATVTVASPREAPQTIPEVSLNSITHPSQDAWYKERSFVADWSAAEGAAPTGWRTAFDQFPETDPGEPLAANVLTKTMGDVADGIWYFHLKGMLADGTETKSVHYRVRVDATAPNPVTPVIPRIRYVEGEEALLEFATTDDTSGIDRYEVSVNDSAFAAAESPLIVSDLKAGDYFIEVKAIDKAGNERFGKTGLRVYSAGTELKEEDNVARKVEQTRIAEIRKEQGAADASKTSNAAIIALALGAAILLGIVSFVSKRRRK